MTHRGPFDSPPFYPPLAACLLMTEPRPWDDNRQPVDWQALLEGVVLPGATVLVFGGDDLLDKLQQIGYDGCS